jgi:hypothetical protein
MSLLHHLQDQKRLTIIIQIFSEMENAPKDRYLKSYITINGFELTADLALTNEQKEKGLSVKDELKESEAMLFIFEESAQHSFWMKDVKFPIDII